LFLISESGFAQRLQNSRKDQPSFAVGPMNLKLSGRPGQTLKSSISIVTQNMKEVNNFSITVSDLGQTDNASPIPVTIGEGARSCAEWVIITDKVRIEENSRLEIPFAINVPRKVNGSYFCFLGVTSEPEIPDAQMAMVVKYQLPVKVELTIPGQSQIRLNATKLSYNPGKV